LSVKPLKYNKTKGWNMHYHDITDLKPLQSFSYIYKNNGTYIINKKCSKKIQNFTSDIKSLSLQPSEFKNKYDDICKKSHKYRIENLYHINNNNLYNLVKYISSAYIITNSNLTFQVSSCKNLLNMLEYFIENKFPLYINKTITATLKENADNETFLKVNLATNKIKQLSNNDFHIVLTKLLAKVQQPVEIKYFSDVITAIAIKSIFNDKQIASYQQEIANKIILGITHVLNYKKENSHYNPQEVLYKIHSLICLVEYESVVLQPNLKKKLTQDIMSLFYEFVRNIDFSIPDLNIIKKQFEKIDLFINSIVSISIKNIAKYSDSLIANINNIQLKLKDKTNLILQQTETSLNSLLYYRNAMDASIINISKIIKDVIEIDLNIQKIADDQEKINFKDDTDVNTTTFSSLVKRKNLLVLIDNENNYHLKLTNCISKLKRKISHLFAIYNAYDQEYNIFNKHIDYYKNSMTVDKLKYYQTFITRNLIDYLKNILYMYIKKNIKISDSTTLVNIIDNALIPKASDIEQVIKIAIMYYASEILLVDKIIIDTNKFIIKIRELQQKNIIANIINEYTCLIKDE
jgi:hypothetical protein